MNAHRPVRARLGTALATLLLVLAACGGDEDTPAAPPETTNPTGATTTAAGGQASTTTTAGTVLSVTVRGGSVVQGASRQRATLNQPVTIRVTSDVTEEVHVHGYDRYLDVAAGQTAETTFVANIPGVFEVEFEGSHQLLFTLEVR